MDFSEALQGLKAGRRAVRSAWAGNGVFIFLVPGSTFTVEEGRPLAAHMPIGSTVDYHAHIDMRTRAGYIVPWIASQADLLANDWGLV